MNNLVILDRDGVINYDSPQYIKSPEEWLALPGSLEGIAHLNQAGFRVVIATNQSGIAKQLFTPSTLESIHQKLIDALARLGGKIDRIFVCPHQAEDFCDCRKPKTGLFQQIQDYYQCCFQKFSIPCIGDSLRDLEAAQRMGATPILVLTGNGQKTLENLPPALQNVPYYDNLLAAALALIKASSLANNRSSSIGQAP